MVFFYYVERDLLRILCYQKLCIVIGQDVGKVIDLVL